MVRPSALVLLLALALPLAGCEGYDDDDSADDDDDSADDDDDAGDDDDSVDEAPDHLNELTTADDFAALADSGAVKYIAPTDAWDRQPPITEDCYLQNTRRFPFHVQFLRTLPGLEDLDPATYEAWVVQPQSRIWWGGAVQLWPGAEHPVTGEPGVMSFVLYSHPFVPQLEVEQVVEVSDRLSGCMPFVDDLVAWLPDGEAQRAFAEDHADALADAGVAVVFPEDLSAGVESMTWSPGEGYGTLRVVPEGEDLGEYGPRDVLVATQAPNEMSLVSGLVTSAIQNPASHINLRLREKGIPSATVPSVYDNAVIAALDGSLVHVVAPQEGAVRIEPATLAEAEAFWEARYPELPPIDADLTVVELAPFVDLRHDDAIAYGAKAASLAELRGVLPAEHRRDGFAIPFAAYLEHIEAHGIDEEIEDMLEDPRLVTDRAWAEDRLDDVRDAIRDAPLDPAFFAELEASIRHSRRRTAETTRLRFRSSTNVEDLDELTGAGLYDSRSGCLGDDLDGDEVGPSKCLSDAERAWIEGEIERWQGELAADPSQTWIQEVLDDLHGDLTEEKTVADAVRKVWRSLWNVRAVDERAWYGIDHRDAYMGIAVHPSFVAEEAEAVLVTNLSDGEQGPVWRLVSQSGELGVVRPVDPTAVAEILTFERAGDEAVGVDLLVESNHHPGPLWTDDQLAALAAAAFEVQDHFEGHVYPHLDPLRLDMEIERLPDGDIVIKQARPYVSFDPGAP